MKLVLFFVLVSTAAFGSGKESHGGGAWVKRGAGDKIVEAQLLDFWEAEIKTIGNQVIVHSDDPVEDQIEAALKKIERLNEGFGKEVRKARAYLIERLKEVTEDGVGIAPPKDLNHRFVKTGFQLEGAASFDEETQEMLVDPRIAAAFKSNTERAGLHVHEAIYKALRDRKVAPDSRRTRRLTGFLFSKFEFTPVTHGLPKRYVICRSYHDTGYLLYAYPTPGAKKPSPRETKFTLQIAEAASLPLVDKTTAEVTHIDEYFNEKAIIDGRKLTDFIKKDNPSASLYDYLERGFKTSSNFEATLSLVLRGSFDDPYEDYSDKSWVIQGIHAGGKKATVRTGYAGLYCRPSDQPDRLEAWLEARESRDLSDR